MFRNLCDTVLSMLHPVVGRRKPVGEDPRLFCVCVGGVFLPCVYAGIELYLSADASCLGALLSNCICASFVYVLGPWGAGVQKYKSQSFMSGSISTAFILLG